MDTSATRRLNRQVDPVAVRIVTDADHLVADGLVAGKRPT
jgi:hypothetical protein